MLFPDQAASTANVKIDVIDVNDNYPEFYPDEYYVNLARSSDVGTVVVVVQATDLDEGEFGEVTYSIVRGASGNGDSYFEVNSETGAYATVGGSRVHSRPSALYLSL